MAGVKRFDEDAVVDSVMTLFWQRGYEATSIDDLVAASGIKRGSLYNAFGDKAAMFLRAFERYQDRIGCPIRAALDLPDARQAIATWLEAQVERLADPETPPGCLATNACLELAQRDDPIGRRIRQEMNQVEDDLYRTLLRAQSQGSLPPGQDLRALARFLHSATRGMALLHKATSNLSEVRDTARVVLSIFDDKAGAQRPSAA